MSDSSRPPRLLAIGDIHGYLQPLDNLLEAVGLRPDDRLVTLGDYIDRGPNARGVIDRLLELDRVITLIPIRGNHDQMMLDIREDPQYLLEWFACGGSTTLESYHPDGGADGLAAVPEDHWAFLESRAVDWYETDTHFFVHGGVRPDVPLAGQERAVLHYEKFIAPLPHCSGKIMVCGHTAQRTGWPRSVGHAVCIDSWVYGLGWLTCLDVHRGTFWQANAAGHVRTGELDEPPPPPFVY